MVSNKYKKLGEIFLNFGIINQQMLEKILKKQLSTEDLLGQLLIKEGIISYDDLAKALSIQFKLPFFDVKNYIPPDKLLEEIPQDLLNKYNFIPLKKLENKIIILIADPTNKKMISDLKQAFDNNIEFFIGNSEYISNIKRKFLLKKGEIKKDIKPIIDKTHKFENINKKNDKIKSFKELNLNSFIETLKNNKINTIICMASGEKLAGKIIDYNKQFIFLETNSVKRLIFMHNIAYIEGKM